MCESGGWLWFLVRAWAAHSPVTRYHSASWQQRVVLKLLFCCCGCGCGRDVWCPHAGGRATAVRRGCRVSRCPGGLRASTSGCSRCCGRCCSSRAPHGSWAACSTPSCRLRSSHSSSQQPCSAGRGDQLRAWRVMRQPRRSCRGLPCSGQQPVVVGGKIGG